MDRNEMVTGVRAVFDLVADEYDNVGVPFFQPIAEGLVEAVGAAPGDRALDLGCGNGASSRALAAAVVPHGSVVGLDLSPAMVDRARRSLEGSGLDATLLVGDASDPDLPGESFDVAISSLVLFFLPEPAAALSTWVRLLAPGGRIGLSTFGPSNDQWQSLEAPLRDFMPPLDPRTVGPQSPFASDEGMAALLADAGASDVRTTTRRVELAFEASSSGCASRGRSDSASPGSGCLPTTPPACSRRPAGGSWRRPLPTAPCRSGSRFAIPSVAEREAESRRRRRGRREA